MSRLHGALISTIVFAAAFPCVAFADAIIEYDTGHPMGPHVLELGVPTSLAISVRDTTGQEWPIGAIFYDFTAPDGGLTWDLLGEDDLPFTEDDGFTWESDLDDIGCYFVTIDPPLSIYVCFDGGLNAVKVPPLGATLMSTLELTGQAVGEFTLTLGTKANPFTIWRADDFFTVPIENGTEQVVLTVVPEVDVGSILLFALLFWASGSRRPNARRRMT